MIPTPPLQGIYALVTRPAQQAVNLCQLIQHKGGKAIKFPTIQIQGISDKKQLSSVAKRLNHFDLAIFISRAAVIHSIATLRQYQEHFPSQLVIGAMGPGTAATLNQYNIRVDFYPSNKATTEELLTIDALQHIEGKRIVLFKGAGGRQLLAQSLRERKAKLTEVVCYQRVIAQIDPQLREHILQNEQINCIISTSVEGMQNLFILLGDRAKKWLQNLPWIVISDRMLNAATTLGIKFTPYVTDNPSDKAIVKTLINFAKGRK